MAWLTLAGIALRLVIFAARRDFVAYDEGFYLLLGRSLWSGNGYMLTGLQHVSLSPLFPLLAGPVYLLLGDLVWAGRIVAAVTAGLLVVPCWSIFHRLGGRRTALAGCALIAVLPALAPFFAPEWMEWQLWVGSEPVLHLFLFTGIALALRTTEERRLRDALLAGVAFALAYLARPEAVIVIGALAAGAGAAAAARRRWREIGRLAALAGAFMIVASPYWLYLHDTLDRWALTGRHVEVATAVGMARPDDGRSSGATDGIERMLWQGDPTGYIRSLYSLAPSGVRLNSTYWGIPEAESARSPGVDETTGERPGRRPEMEAIPRDGNTSEAPPDAEADAGSPATPDGVAAFTAESSAASRRVADPGLARVARYFGALDAIVPSFLWPFFLIGLLRPRRRRGRAAAELLAFGPLAVSSFLIAFVVAIDPRTQLLVLPVLTFYAARGMLAGGSALARRISPSVRHRRQLSTAVVVIAVAVVALQQAARVYRSATRTTDSLLLAAETSAAGRTLERLVPAGEPVMSWHPAFALFADRDWRVLPLGSFPDIMHYAASTGTSYVLLSVFYPSPIEMADMPREHLLVRVPSNAPAGVTWRVRVDSVVDEIAVGEALPE